MEFTKKLYQICILSFLNVDNIFVINNIYFGGSQMDNNSRNSNRNDASGNSSRNDASGNNSRNNASGNSSRNDASGNSSR